jgi:hypothetical protein
MSGSRGVLGACLRLRQVGASMTQGQPTRTFWGAATLQRERPHRPAPSPRTIARLRAVILTRPASTREASTPAVSTCDWPAQRLARRSGDIATASRLTEPARRPKKLRRSIQTRRAIFCSRQRRAFAGRVWLGRDSRPSGGDRFDPAVLCARAGASQPISAGPRRLAMSLDRRNVIDFAPDALRARLPAGVGLLGNIFCSFFILKLASACV